MKITLAILSSLQLLISTSIYSQENVEPKIIPPSPNAASLGVYGDNPVSNYTGSPNINIPLHTIQHGDITIPISLNYRASGIRVSEQASNVGLGWSLNAGGVITKTVKGLDDFAVGSGPYSYAGKTNTDILNLTAPNNAGVLTGDDLNRARNISNGIDDGEPDLYFFNFGGRSGKFIFTNEGAFVFDRQELKVEITTGQFSPPQEISSIDKGWKITDERGFVYEFHDIEITKPMLSMEKNSFISSWYLSKITSPNGHEVTFQYDTGAKKVRMPNSKRESLKVPIAPNGIMTAPDPNSPTISQSYSEIQEVYLESITYPNGYLLFDYSMSRLDRDPSGSTHSTGRALSAITLLNSSGDNPLTDGIVNISLSNQSYFTSNDVGYAHDKHRLKLDAVQIEDKNYSFQYYNQNNLPSISSPEQDHWGFFNNNNSFRLVPTVDMSVFVANDPGTLKADVSFKEPNAETAHYGLLEKITYPTGGSTTFEYESHDYSKIADTPVGEDVYEWQLAPSVGADTNPLTVDVSGTEYSDYIEVTPSDVGFKLDVYINYNVYNESTDVKVELLRPTFANVPLDPIGNDPIDYSQYYVPENIIDEGTPIKYYWISGNSYPLTEEMALTPGIYMLKAVAIPLSSSASAVLHKKAFLGTTTTKLAGGVRIKTITDHDGINVSNDLVKKFTYTSESDPTLSSGILVSKPEYLTLRSQLNPVEWAPGMYYADLPVCVDGTSWYELSSNSSTPLGSTNGSHIGYDHVEITYTNYNQTESNGRTTYEYSSAAQHQDSPQAFPPSSGSNNDMFRGQLLKTVDFNASGDTVRITENEYLFDTYKSFWTANLVSNFPQMSGANELGACAFSMARYPINIAKSFLTSTITKDCQNNCLTFSEKRTDYVYDKKSENDPDDAHTFLTKSSTVSSDGKVFETQSKYPKDFTSPSSVILSMISKNIIGIPIETIQKVDAQVVSASATRFAYDNVNDIVQPEDIYRFETTTPGISFSESTDGYAFNSYNKKATYHKYDNKGNVLEFSKEDGVYTCYIWGYNQAYPVAQIVNATFAQIEALQGFSANFHAGTAGLTPGQEDILRDNLPNAQVTTYSYKVNFGVSSIVDPNGQKTEYTYDDSMRLKYIKDDDGNIIRKNEYNYKTSSN